ncbi:MAG: WecB/TagA/CpsF family glycosyltransferase [Peptoanaerobacter stomatis]
MEKINILGVEVDRVDMKQATENCINAIENNKKLFIVTPNSEIIVNAGENKTLFNIIKSADMVVPDGIGLVIASKMMKKPLKERVTGIDLMESLLKYCNEKGKSIFLLGAKHGIAQKAGEKIKEKYPNIRLAGTYHGYYKGIHSGAKGSEEEKEVIDMINKSKPDILFVAFGSPKQEYFIDAYKDIIDAKVFIGVGGSLDVYSGTIERAPKFYQEHGLEWLYRLSKEPQRITRMGALPVFLTRVLLKKDKNKFSK